jgi:hypothetical protein
VEPRQHHDAFFDGLATHPRWNDAMDPYDHKDVVGPLRRAMEEAGHSAQLYPWMWTRYAAFQALLAETRRPDWRRIAIGLAKVGVTDARGNSPTAATTRQTWWKVRRDVAVRSKPPSPAPHCANSETDRNQIQSPPKIRPSPGQDDTTSEQGFDPDDVEEETTAESEFRPATPRFGPPAAELSKPQGRGASSKLGRDRDYDVVLRQLADRGRARSLAMPRILTAEDE